MFKTLNFQVFIKFKRIFVRNVHKKQIEMKYLNVAEKNDAAKTIAGLLSNGSARRREGYSVYNKIYDFESTVKGVKSKMTMTSVSGHLLECAFLTAYKNWNSVDPISLFDAPVRKICKDDYLPIKRTLEREIRGCNGLIIWTDCDREGENIGFEIIEVCRAVKPNIPVYRAKFSEITSQAVRRALQNLAVPDQRQNDAVEVRSELDLRTGAAITRFQTLRFSRLFPQKIAGNLISYGSCQIPTLGFVAERYKEIEAFVSEPFWKIKVLHTIDDLTVEFFWARNRLFDKQACEDFLLVCLADPKAKVECVTVKPKSKYRPQPLDTVEMEKLGSRKLKLSAKDTMTIAEKLYTKGIISYPRTETNQFTNEIDLRSLVEQQTGHGTWGSFAERVMEWGPNPRNGNKSDQAHPPIHPTKLVTNLEGNEARVYELICRHFLACVSKDATGSETVVHINIGGEKFTATGLCIFERNYLDVYIYDKWNAKQIHKYEEGQIFDPTEISMQEGKTTPPALLTEADLIALMEKHGIGTDATHAEHINTIKQRGYVGVLDKGFLVPGVIGMGLYEGYDAMQLALAKPLLRAEFESDLKKICLGEKDPKVVLREQIQKYKEAYRQIMERVTAMDDKMAQRLNETPAASASNSDQPSNENNDNGSTENRQFLLKELLPCPKCKVASLALKPRKNQSNSFYIGCLNYPDCKNAIWLPTECTEPTILEESCERCGSNVKLLKVKITSSYYKTLLNVPSGRYKTCLRCDAKFREAFNINLESVKDVGGIVSEAAERTTTTTTTTTTSRNGRTNSASIFSNLGSSTSTNQSNNNRAQSSRTNRDGQQTRKTQPIKGTKTNDKTTKTKNNNTNGSVRTYFTNASSNELPQQSPQASTVNEIDTFFDSNDGFDDLILSSDIVPSNNLESGSVNRPQATSALNEFNSEDLAAIIETDFEMDQFDDIVTNSDRRAETASSYNVNRVASNLNPSSLRTDANTVNSHNEISDFGNCDDSFGELLRTETIDFDNFAWGTAGRNRRENSAPQPKRPRLEDKPCSSNTRNWSSNTSNTRTPARVDDSNTMNNEEQNVNCNGCQKPAKKLTVKKDGPNKGRMFYVCQQDKQCKFFQWADEESNVNTSLDQSLSTSPRTTNHSTTNWNSERPRSSTQTNNYSWGASASSSATNSNNLQTNNYSWGTSSATSASNSNNYNWGTSSTSTTSNSNNLPPNNYSWGTSSNAKVSHPQSGGSSNRNTTSATHSNQASMNDNEVKCNCGINAKSLTVKKDGPNKGRQFYACLNRGCDFFKWADADDNQASTSNGQGSSSSSTWGTGNRKTTESNNQRSRDNTDGKKRKCGLCRQEGHTRQKCPRKAEFEF